MPCSLAITSPGRMLSQQDSVEIYTLAYIIEAGQPIGTSTRIEFVEFLGVAHLFYYFTEFSLPFDDGTIGLKDVQRAIDAGVLPTTLTPKQVIGMYDGVEDMPFQSFGGLLWAQRIFSKYDASGEARW